VVGVVVAAERERQAIDRDPIELAGVAIRLFDLADQGAVHLARPSRPPRGAMAAAVRSCTDRARRARVKPTPATPSGHHPQRLQFGASGTARASLSIRA